VSPSLSEESSNSEPIALPQGNSTIYLPLILQKPTVFYVSKNGSDQNPGSIDQPWKTIQKAANTLVAGDTVYIRGGTYNERVNLVNRNNGANSYITFVNYPGESVILNGNGIAIQYGFGLFHIEKSSFIRVSGLQVQYSNGAGIYVGYSNNIKVDNNRTYDTVKSGIGIWASKNVVVDNNDIALACNAHPNYLASEENISIAAGSSNVEVKNNYVHQAANIPDGYAGGEGINVKDGAHDVNIHHNIVHLDERTDGKPSNRLAFGLDAWKNETYNIRFYNNIAYNNRVGFVIESEAGATARDIYVFNNIAYNNGTGYLIPNWAQNETSLKKNIYFINNTSYKNTTGINVNSVKIENIIIRNNIFWQDAIPIRIGSTVNQSQIISEYNLINIDPKFINAAGGDFRLLSSSPAIDLGSSINAPNTDFAGNPRPQGTGFDIGAYEYISP
jgi:parallel beta-helix repeat protein